jgi:hypothetical protein
LPTLTVTPNAVSTPYDGTTLDNTAYSDHTAHYSITGFQNSETFSSAGVTLSGSLAFNGSTSTAVKDVGIYSQTIGTLALSAVNYAMNFSKPAPHDYVITAKSVNVTADTGQFKAKGTPKARSIVSPAGIRPAGAEPDRRSPKGE